MVDKRNRSFSGDARCRKMELFLLSQLDNLIFSPLVDVSVHSSLRSMRARRLRERDYFGTA